MTDPANSLLSPVTSRILHCMLRVRDLDASLDFYCRLLGMRLLRRNDYPTGAFSLVFLGYGEEDAHTVLELTHNWDGRDYRSGDGFGHIAIAVADVRESISTLEAASVTVTRQAGPMAFATPAGPNEVIAFITDPDGYAIELIERA